MIRMYITKQYLNSVYFLAVLFINSLVFSSCSSDFTHKNADYKIIMCTIDSIATVGGEQTLHNNGNVFGGIKTQDSTYAYSGKYSSKVEGAQKYGVSYQLTVKSGERYKVTVLRHLSSFEGYLAVDGKENFKDLFLQTGTNVTNKNSEWGEMEVYFEVPQFEGDSERKVSVFVYTNQTKATYFDDLKIERLSEVNVDFNPEKLVLTLKDKNIDKLELIRDKAFSKGFLINDDNSWVKGKLEYKEDSIKSIKLRLKGDHLDHLQGDKWSFRVKVRKGKTWNGVRKFSLHTPKARFMLGEWMYHKALEEEDILTTRYDFISLTLNDKDLGVYAWEEHFEKYLVENKRRREGVIVRFDESYMWDNRVSFYAHDIKAVEKDMIRNSHITTFGENKMLNDSVLRNQFKIAQNLLQQYRYGTIKVSDIFDIQRLAKYYAITDIFKAYHGIIWHNERYYYNPVTSKLEPIGFDGYAEQIFDWIKRPFLGYKIDKNANGFKEPIFDALFEDDEFKELYIKNLNKYSNPDYMNNLFSKYFFAIKSREEFFSSEFSGYGLDKKKILDNAKRIHVLLKASNNHSIQAFSDGNLLNVHGTDIKIIGYGGDSLMLIEHTIDTSLILPPHNAKKVPQYTNIVLDSTAKYIYYKVLGLDSIHYSQITKRPSPVSNITIRQQIDQKGQKSIDNSLFVKKEKQLLVKKGDYTITEDVVVPSGYEVKIEAGVNINFINKSKFLSYSPVFILGAFDDKVRIYSSDSSANGFSIIQTQKSIFEHVIFTNYNTLDDSGWRLTGAITFYETDVDMNHVSIVNSHCEDALNIVRSTFNIQNLTIDKTLSDGFDADFCVGKIVNSTFKDTGNDGMDFSGSNITIRDCSVNNAGDKGLSAGEQASVYVISLNIDQSVIGVASKDFSKVYIDHIKMKRCKTGFAAYQKKPEYGSAAIKVKKVVFDSVEEEESIEKGSKLIVEEKEVS